MSPFAAKLAAALVALTLAGTTLVNLGAHPGPSRPQPTAAPTLQSTVIVAAGDIACRPSAPATPGACQQGATANAVLGQRPDAVLTLGDNQYLDGALPAYRAAYAPTWGRFLRRTYPTPGNHEYRTAGAVGYFDYFGARAASRGRGWYSYDLGGWHLVAVNSDCSKVDCQAELAWLRADLATHPAGCTLAYWHFPRFSSGHEGNARSVGRFWSALYAAGAEVVLNGHDHDYERFAPQDPQGRPDPARGIREFVVGTGGARPLPFRALRANSQVRKVGSFGVLRLTLEPGGYRWRFVHAAGVSFADQGSAFCH